MAGTGVGAGATGGHEGPPEEREALGKYRLLAKLGEGGMATVHLAVAHGPLGFHKLLVVKQVRTALVDEPDVLEMFFDEARVAARLNHPNVVQTLEVNATPEGWPFIAMEYLDGQPFHRVLGRLGVGPGRYGNLPLYVRVIADTLEGLHYAHELADYDGAPLDIVHRDVSPHNVFVTYDGQVKLVDFGIAKAVISAALTRTGALKGKVPYMAPEQARGDKIDRRADVFAAGVLLWNVLCEQRLWQGMNELAVLQCLVGGKLPSPDEAMPAAPAELRAVLARALAVDVAERYQTAAEMRRDLERYLHGTGATLSPREVGDYVATYFAEERGAMRALIDARLRSAQVTGQAPGLPATAAGRTGPAAEVPSSAAAVTSSGRRASFSGWQGGVATRPSGPAYEVPSARHGPGYYAPPPTSPGASYNPSLLPPPPPAPARGPWAPLALFAGTCVVAGTLWFSLHARPQPPAAPAAPVVEAAAAVPAEGREAPAAAAGPITLEVEASPAEARLFLDGKPLEKNPFGGSFQRDDKVHVLRAEARGFVSREREIVFQRDARVQFALDRERPAAAPPRPGRPPAAAPPAPGGAAKPNVRQVDDDNPYKKAP